MVTSYGPKSFYTTYGPKNLQYNTSYGSKS